MILELEECTKYLDKQEWTYAKTYDKTFPHYYLNRDKVEDSNMFSSVIETIRECGVVKSFYKMNHFYLELGKFEYWEMGRPIAAVKILNKAVIDNESDYRKINISDKMKEALRSNLKNREQYVRSLVALENKTKQQEEELKILMDNRRKIQGGGENIIDNPFKMKYYD